MNSPSSTHILFHFCSPMMFTVLIQQFSMCGLWCFGSTQDSFRKSMRSKIFSYYYDIICLLHCVDICTDLSKSICGWNCWALVRISNSIRVISLSCTCSKKKPVLVKNVFDEAAKIMIFIKSWPLSLLNILYDEIGKTHEAFLLRVAVPWLSQGKALA